MLGAGANVAQCVLGGVLESEDVCQVDGRVFAGSARPFLDLGFPAVGSYS